MNEANSKLWLEKYRNTEGWNHFHTDFWAPHKTTAIKSYNFPDIVVCIYGNGKLRTNPNNENLYSNNFSIIINDKLLDELARKKVDVAVKKIKRQLYGCYYFHFKAPWTKCKVMISADGNASFHVDYMLADVDGAFLSGGCINYLNDCKWNNIYCDESEIIEKDLLP
ncbi:MAG: hypothetical protein EOO04_04880 [Chitinophagaceae bacterium]|nr:MAG: hypothetical protein EOO04_04880 [Chitinophagaceae bacterium]